MPAFDDLRIQAWPHQFQVTMEIPHIAGGTPSDTRVAEGWIKAKMGLENEQLIQEAVAKTMEERGISEQEAIKEVSVNKHLNGFKRDKNGLYYEGRCLKAALKESFNVAADSGKIDARGYGNNSRKGVTSFVAEHVFVVETKLYLGRTEPDGMTQKFVHTWRGSGIQYEEYCEDVTLKATIITDCDFSDREWAMVWLTMEQEGIGSSRSQGSGRFTATEWERLHGKPGTRKKAKAITAE